MKRLMAAAGSPQFRKRVSIWLAGFFVLFTVTGFLIVPPIVKSVLTKKLSEALHREVTIGKVRVNPYVLSVDLSGVAVRERAGGAVFVSFDNLHLNFEAVSIIKGGPVLKEIRLEKPYVNIVRNEDETYNFSDLLEQPKQAPAPQKPSKPLKFSLNNIRISGGSIDFADGPHHTGHKVREMNIAIPFLSNLSYYVETFVQPSFEAKVNGTPVAFKGESKPFADSFATSLNVDVRNVDVPYYLAYVPFALDFKVPSAYLDAKVEIAYTQYKDRKPTLALTGNIYLRDVKVTRGPAPQPLISFPLLDVGMAESDLLAPAVHFSKVHLQSPAVSLRRDRAGKLNLPGMPGGEDAGPGKARAAEQTKKKGGALIEADELLLTDGTVAFEDESVEKPFRTTVSGITAKVAHFSTAAEKKAAADLSLKTEIGETLGLKADFSVEPLAADGSLEVKQIRINKYAPYYDKTLLFDIPAGSLDISTGWHVAGKDEDLSVRLSGLSAALGSLRLRRKEAAEDFLAIPAVSVSETDIDLSRKELTVGSLATQKGMIRVRRTRDGKVNIEGLVAPSPPPVPAAGGVKKKGLSVPEKPWLVALKKLAVEQYAVRIEDDVPSSPALFTIEKIMLRGDNISTARNARGRMSAALTLNKSGTVTASGTVGLEPMAVNAVVALKQVELMPLQPYFTDKVRIYVTDGHISASGSLAAGYTKETGLRASYKGDAALNKFATVDKANADDLLKWESLHFDGIDASYAPLRLVIKEVALSEFYTRLIINPDGSLNLQGIMAAEAAQTPPPAAAPQQAAAAAAPPAKQEKGSVKIEKVSVQGGTVNFSDRFIKPNYSANLLEIGGRITGLSSEETVMADVDLRGKLENYAPLEITGKINPLREDLFVDLKADFKDMDLSPITPYSGRYLGYTIHKGKLSLNLKYLIVKKKLDAQNDIFLDQFTLGDRVESPEATKLPVKLAIALLKNRKGEIKLDVPVSGELDDPKFSVGRIIIKILLNLLVKAATSPFALLGAIMGGGGEELSYVEFDAGSALITEQGARKLETLVKALYDRPALKLDMEGHVDAEKDREGLRQYLFGKKIRAQKLKDMVKQGKDSMPVDEIKVGQEEYAKYLKLAYKDEKFPKPRNIIGIAKDLPVPEMEKLMLTHIVVSDDDLRQLASRRALAVKEYILKGKQVEPERVFLAEPKTLGPEKKDKVKDSRVDFRLK